MEEQYKGSEIREESPALRPADNGRGLQGTSYPERAETSPSRQQSLDRPRCHKLDRPFS